MNSKRIRLMVVDDHEVVRVGVASVLSRDEAVEIVGTASSGEEAMRIFNETRPEVVILDHRLSDVTGAKLCEEMIRLHPPVSVIMLTSFDSDEVVHACLVAGAKGFLNKGIGNDDLTVAVHIVAEGRVYLAPEITERLVMWARRARNVSDGSTLSSEEVEVLELVAKGFRNRQIANALCVSESTAKARLQTAMRKLGTSKRLDAVAAGLRRGVI